MLWYSADLVERLRLASSHVCAMLDADHDYMPYFRVGRYEDGYTAAGSYAPAMQMDIPQVAGRGMDALFYAAEITGEPIPAKAEAEYTRHLLACFDNDEALPSVTNPNEGGKRFVDGHSMREGLEGLTWLIERRHNHVAEIYAFTMLRTLRKLTRDDYGLDPELIRAAGLGDCFWTMGEIQTINAGRLVGPLVKYYRATGDPLALELADIYSHQVMARSFSKEGLVTDMAWYHVHSVTSTLSGVLDYALTVNDERLVDDVRRVFEVGLREMYSSYGWVKELAWLEVDQGEVNQFGDLIQVQLMLAESRDPRYYAQAETWMRSAVLPSQVIDSSICNPVAEPRGDFERDIPNRVLGGFGFPTPSCHLRHKDATVPTDDVCFTTVDITQGAVQAMAEFARRAVTRTGLGVQVNLLVSGENDLAKVESELPVRGRLRVTMKHSDNLLVRIPEQIEPGSLNVTRSGEPIDVAMRGIYALLRNDKPGRVFEIAFTPKRFDRSEYVYHKPYNVSWYGEQVIGIDPVNGVYPLYGKWPE